MELTFSILAQKRLLLHHIKVPAKAFLATLNEIIGCLYAVCICLSPLYKMYSFDTYSNIGSSENSPEIEIGLFFI